MEDQSRDAMKKIFVIINCILLAVGNVAGPLVMRLYFINGGNRIWLTTWVQSGGFPIILIPLISSYWRRRLTTTAARAKLFCMSSKLFLVAVVVGVLTGLDNYMYAYGIAKLPVSTAALLLSTQLGFTAVFAFFLVKQKFTAYTVNAVALLTAGAALLGLNTSSDRPEGETNKEYILGFIMTVLAAALYGFVLPFIELMYKKLKQALTYTVVLEFQFVMCFFATVFCTVGMLINKDFQAIPAEAKQYELGEAKYYLVVVSSCIIWQCAFLGLIGVVFFSSSLLSALIITFTLPVAQVFAVIFFHEKFQAEKGVSLFLSLWGFMSYFYGEAKQSKKKEEINDDGNSQLITNQTTETQLTNVRTSVP